MFTDLKIPAGRRPLTAAEARITAIVGTLFALMILAAVFEEYSAERLGIVFIIVFWAPMLLAATSGGDGPGAPLARSRAHVCRCKSAFRRHRQGHAFE
jgi:hypothetical protein